MMPPVYNIDNEAFCLVEQAHDVNKVLKPVYSPLAGWRQRHNRKQQAKD
jgi:hypothetical protein